MNAFNNSVYFMILDWNFATALYCVPLFTFSVKRTGQEGHNVIQLIL